MRKVERPRCPSQVRGRRGWGVAGGASPHGSILRQSEGGSVNQGQPLSLGLNSHAERDSYPGCFSWKALPVDASAQWREFRIDVAKQSLEVAGKIPSSKSTCKSSRQLPKDQSHGPDPIPRDCQR